MVMAMDASDHSFPSSTSSSWSYAATDGDDVRGGVEGGEGLRWSNQSRVMQINRTPLQVTIYGYVAPVVATVTAITNALICVILLRRTMRSPTNILLVAMAVSDMLTGLIPMPPFLYFYTLQLSSFDWVPYDWCFPYVVLIDYLPTVCHTASIWLTVTLALQRYVAVCHPHRAKATCTVPNAIKATAIVYGLSLSSQLSRFVEANYSPAPIAVPPSVATPVPELVGCTKTYVAFVQRHEHVYFSVYYWFRVIFIHLVPCSSLVLLNALLIRAMRAAERRRSHLLRQRRRAESHRIQESNVTTMMLVSVVGLFLVVEFPLAVVFILVIVDKTFALPLLDSVQRQQAALVTNACIMLSYPVNFFIYCAMSRAFRETFLGLFLRTSTNTDRLPSASAASVARKPSAVTLHAAAPASKAKNPAAGV